MWLGYRVKKSEIERGIETDIQQNGGKVVAVGEIGLDYLIAKNQQGKKSCNRSSWKIFCL